MDEKQAFAPETLSAKLDASKLDEQDKSFATALVYGVSGSRGTLDELLQRYAHAPQKLKSKVALALKISLFELFFTEREAYAIVSQGVDLVASIHNYSKNTANAILRAAERERGDFPFGDPATDEKAFSRLHGSPHFLYKKLKSDRGEVAARSIIEALNTPAPLFAYLPPKYKSAFKQNYQTLARGLQGETVRLNKPSAAVMDALVKERKVLIMDQNAQQTVYVATKRTKESLLEIGSGRGSKSLMLSSELGPSSQIVAVDLHDFKSTLLREQIEQLKVTNITPLTADAQSAQSLGAALDAAQLPNTYSCVLVDAPCSGIGTLRRHQDKRWKIMQKDIDSLANLSYKLLSSASKFVSEEGRIIYASCTMSYEENEGLVARFLESDSGSKFEIEALSPGDVIAGSEKYLNEQGQFMSLPSINEADGHFITVLRLRKGE